MYPNTHWDVDSLGVVTAWVEWDPCLRVWSFVLCKSEAEATYFFSFGREKMPPALIHRDTHLQFSFLLRSCYPQWGTGTIGFGMEGPGAKCPFTFYKM